MTVGGRASGRVVTGGVEARGEMNGEWGIWGAGAWRRVGGHGENGDLRRGSQGE